MQPLGSFSRIVDESDEGNKLELFYGSDSSMLQRMRGGSKFDRGMAAFMQCVLQLQNHITILRCVCVCVCVYVYVYVYVHT